MALRMDCRNIVALTRPSRDFSFTLSLLVFVVSASIRFALAPLAAGSDVGQFWAFAKTFQIYGLDFYNHNDVPLEFWPYGWPYCYPPIWLLLLALSYFLAPVSEAYSPAWRLVVKAPIIVADLSIGFILLRMFPENRRLGLIASSLWLLNPWSIYISSIFGQFDAISVVFLFSSVYMFESKRTISGGVLSGLALMTKQYALFPICLILLSLLRERGLRHALTALLTVVSVFVAFTVPFSLTTAFRRYVETVWLVRLNPYYPNPLCYSFNGIFSLLTYLHNLYGWDTLQYFETSFILLVSLLVASGIHIMLRRPSDYDQVALLGILSLLITFWLVNPQYLVAFIPFMIVDGVRNLKYRKWTKALFLTAFVPSVWLWVFDVSLWFRLYGFSNEAAIRLLQLLRLTSYRSDIYYLAFSVVLSCLLASYFLLIIKLKVLILELFKIGRQLFKQLSERFLFRR